VKRANRADPPRSAGDGVEPSAPDAPEPPPRGPNLRDTGWGRWTVRLVALLGVVLIAVSAVGWWLSTRVLDSHGFADVVAISSQKQEVRDYIADQATLRLARSNNFVSAARPIVTDAVSQAIATPPVEEAVRDFAVRAHDQIFSVTEQKRVSVSSAQAAVTVRTALESINPSLARKLPPNVLSATTTISQSPTVDTLVGASRWVDDLYIPVFLIGIGLLALVIWKSKDRVHAIRVTGILLAVAGALLFGIGATTPAFADAAGTNDPGRGEAVARFIEVLLGRLVGAGKGMVVVGIALALAPGHDGGDLRHRWARARAWVTVHRASARWRFAGGLLLALAAVWLLTNPTDVASAAVVVVGVLVLYAAIVVCLRASGVLVTDHEIKRIHTREVALVLVAMIAGVALTASAAVAVVSSSTEQERANPTNQGCNGYIELCAFKVNQIVWPASHNAMASSAYDFLGAEHSITVPEQLNAGARFLMLDAYYGYDDGGLIRTNLAGGVDRKQLEADRGAKAVRELDRIGALTGAADTSGKKKDIYFCHSLCELGAVSANEVLGNVRDFLDRNLTDVVILDIEDYVKPQDFKQALIDADLFDRVWIPKKPGEWPTLRDMVVPKNTKAEQNPRRVIVMYEKHPSPYKWLLNTYNVSEETNFSYSSAAKFDCAPKRGKTGKSFFIVNHWVDSGGAPDPVDAAKTNSEKTLTKRVQDCITTRGKLPNTIAVNFTTSGDLFSTVKMYNAAIARQSGVTQRIDDVVAYVRYLRSSTTLTKKERTELKRSLKDIRALRRLPHISARKARALLGPLADSLPPAPSLTELVKPDVPTKAELEALKAQDAAQQASGSGTTTTTAPPATTPPSR
jgi:hypothetical protein